MHQKLKKIIDKELKRQQNTIGLIPSENFTSKAVREAVGSVLMHKYSEGYPDARYYEGNEVVDELEKLAKEMVKKVFSVGEDWHANVQPLSGSVANLAVYNAVLKPGDTILSMYLSDGGHLSHGWSFEPKNSQKEDSLNEDKLVYEGGSRKISIVSKIYNVIQYKTDPETLQFDFDELERIAEKYKPKMIITGGTAYPRDMNYEKVSKIAKEVGAYYLADIAHEAGLVAAKVLNQPFEYADFVTFTTHKTFRGPKGAVAMCKSEFAEQLDKSIFPGMQGGPFNHTIAGVTQALFEIDTPEFVSYTKQIILNNKVLAESLKEYNFDIVSGDVDKHLTLINLRNKNIRGKHAAKALAKAGIVANMNTVPWDAGSPFNPNGLRLGTPIVTTRGMKESEMTQIAEWINQIINAVVPFAGLKIDEFVAKLDEVVELSKIRKDVEGLCAKFPLVV